VWRTWISRAHHHVRGGMKWCKMQIIHIGRSPYEHGASMDSMRAKLNAGVRKMLLSQVKS
jgi:hypothetical protein